MVRGDFAWVNVNDGENAIGVWLSKELAGEIKLPAATTLRATGWRLLEFLIAIAPGTAEIWIYTPRAYAKSVPAELSERSWI